MGCIMDEQERVQSELAAKRDAGGVMRRDDPRTAEVLSKVLLLARDREIGIRASSSGSVPDRAGNQLRRCFLQPWPRLKRRGASRKSAAPLSKSVSAGLFRSQEAQSSSNDRHGEQEILLHDDRPEEDTTKVDLDETGVTKRAPDLIGNGDAAGRTMLGHSKPSWQPSFANRTDDCKRSRGKSDRNSHPCVGRGVPPEPPSSGNRHRARKIFPSDPRDPPARGRTAHPSPSRPS